MVYTRITYIRVSKGKSHHTQGPYLVKYDFPPQDKKTHKKCDSSSKHFRFRNKTTILLLLPVKYIICARKPAHRNLALLHINTP